MKTWRHIVALLALGAVMTGCEIYYPHDRGLHRGEYERDHDRGHDRGDRRDDRRDHERDRDHHD
ncbi:MAG TPA: hypothetical protein VNH42_02855 [Mariprofundaceae bacterium]|nr:hypothetical protein [Mariprofundaceae bacterium]